MSISVTLSNSVTNVASAYIDRINKLAREKEKTRQKNENALNELLEQDKFKALLEEIESDDLKHETIQKKIRKEIYIVVSN